jgi:glucose/arabinose dehydrogenase
MRISGVCLSLVVSVSMTVQLIPTGAFAGCPPTPSWNVPGDEAGLVLTDGVGLMAERVAGPFEVPWAVGLLPDGSFLVTERPGQLQHVTQAAGTYSVDGVPPVLYSGHGGLLDVEVDPNFQDNGTIYLSYLQGEETASIVKVMRAHFDADREALTDQQVIFEGSPGARPELLGGRIALTDDGYLFLSLGERWDRDKAQDLSDTSGKIVRIKVDGSIPDDNPFRYVPGARPEIWSYGHRNPQGLVYDAATRELWSDEHGPQGGDELNLIQRGGNYGWPIATYGVDYSGRPIAVNSEAPGTMLPVRYWVPISIAPSSLSVETGPSSTEIWMGALAGQMVVQLTLDGNCVLTEEHLFRNQLGRIRDVRVDDSGTLYILTDGDQGMLYRVERPPISEDDKTHL